MRILIFVSVLGILISIGVLVVVIIKANRDASRTGSRDRHSKES